MPDTLVVRRLPEALTERDLNELFHYFGGIEAKRETPKGKMRRSTVYVKYCYYFLVFYIYFNCFYHFYFNIIILIIGSSPMKMLHLPSHACINWLSWESE